MSLKTWKAAYYTTPACVVPQSEAVAHSLKKWRGLRQDALAEHGVRKGENSSVITDGTSRFFVDGDSCALCQHYAIGIDGACRECPIMQALGYACDEGEPKKPSAYESFESKDNPEPMIAALEQAERWERKQKAKRTKKASHA